MAKTYTEAQTDQAVSYVGMAMARREQSWESTLLGMSDKVLHAKEEFVVGKVLPGAVQKLEQEKKNLEDRCAAEVEHIRAYEIIARLSSVKIGSFGTDQMTRLCTGYLTEKMEREHRPSTAGEKPPVPSKADVLEYMQELHGTLTSRDAKGKTAHDEFAKLAVKEVWGVKDKEKAKNANAVDAYIQRKDFLSNRMLEAITKLGVELQTHQGKSASAEMPDNVKALVESGQWKSVPLGNDQQAPSGSAALLAVAKPAVDKSGGFSPA